MIRFVAIVLVVAVTALGIAFRDHQYRLDSRFMASDQSVLDHRDSVYTSMTWVASEQDDYLQLRFFDKVEGGVCMHPTWADLIQFAKTPGSNLDHLVPTGDRPHGEAAGPAWTYPDQPDPGTLPNSPYVRLFPIAPLMIDRIAAAGPAARIKILVVGLGSGTGIAVLAHHFPGAAITVIDIDGRVIQMVRDHYPLIDWLATQKFPDGMPRLRLETGDARQFIRFHPAAEGPYDIVILDAYTAGSTIPSHLMTREFYHQCADIIAPDGVLLANVIGSVNGDKHRVLGGAIRTFRAGGLTSVVDFPVLQPKEAVSNISLDSTRNNILVAAKIPLDPAAHPAAWKRLADFVPFPQLPLGTYTAHDYLLCRSTDSDWLTALVDAHIADAASPSIAQKLSRDGLSSDALQSVIYSRTQDSDAVNAARAAVLDWAAKHRDGHVPFNWDGTADTLVRCDTDWVLYARETFRTSVIAGHDVSRFGGDALVGPEWPDPLATKPDEGELIPDAPLFTDERPNGDIMNR